jgi:hypothetical protein
MIELRFDVKGFAIHLGGNAARNQPDIISDMTATLTKSQVILSKVVRAKKHIEDLSSALKGFWELADNAVRYEDDPETNERTYYIDRVTDIPLDILVIIGDVLHNLRSALDHLAYQLPLAPGEIRGRTQFPIAESYAKYMSTDIRKGVTKFRKDAVEALDSLSPYKGGNELLWSLHSLNIIDKHRLLLTASITNYARSMTPAERENLTKGYLGSYPDKPPPDFTRSLMFIGFAPLKAGDKLWTIPQSELGPYTQFHVDVGFNEPDVMEYSLVVHTLQGMATRVEQIVQDFEPLLSRPTLPIAG